MTRRSLAILAALVFSQLGTIYIQTTITGSAPLVRGVGTYGKSVATVKPGLPTGWAAGDLLIAFFETSNSNINPPVTSPIWNPLPGGVPWLDVGTPPNGSRITIFYREAQASETVAMRTFSDSGDHGCGILMGIETGTFDSTTPLDVETENAQGGATTAVSVTGDTTTTAFTLVIAASTSPYDCNGCATHSGLTNANLTNLTEQFDSSCSNGNGGSLMVGTGTLETASASGATTATSTQTDIRANKMLAINAD